ncbi:MAG: GDSL-type esterase/lipase family protein [Myxococcota bacterium]
MTTRSERPRRRVGLAALLLLACAAGEVPAGAEGASLAAGGRRSYATLSHACAVVDGGLQCWGAAERGQLGEGMAANRRPVPVRVAGLSDVRDVAAGGAHTCALAAGRVHCFGDNADGQGGAPRPFVMLDPTPVAGLPEPVDAVAAGLAHTCAIAAGQVLCWGRNERGESGAPPRDDCREPHRVKRCSVPPTRVAGVGGPARALALGDRYGCALADGRVWCWGGKASDPRASPVDLPSEATAIAAGGRHTCALLAGTVWCWSDAAPEPAPIDLPAPVAHLAAGGPRTCAADAERAWCWAHASPQPERVAGLAAPIDALAVGLDHACARSATAVRCWGDNDAGQLGRGPTPDADARAAPVATWDDGRWRDVNGDGRITLVCLGDSNTQAMPGAPSPWCERLRERLGDAVAVVNRGQGGATALPSLVPGEAAVRHAVRYDAPDLAVVAYGTNDLMWGHAPESVARASARLAADLRSEGASVWVALVPPVRASDVEQNRAVRQANAVLRAEVPAPWVLDFHSGLGDEQLWDRVHLTGAGQARLAEVAAAAILRLRPGDAP